MHDLPYLPHCITAPMHQCVDISMHVHGKTKKTLKETGMYTYENKLEHKHIKKE